jgi:hypothetical protein
MWTVGYPIKKPLWREVAVLPQRVVLGVRPELAGSQGFRCGSGAFKAVHLPALTCAVATSRHTVTRQQGETFAVKRCTCQQGGAARLRTCGRTRIL